MYVANIGNGPSTDNAVSVVEAASNVVVARVPVTWPWRIAISPDGTRVYAANQSDTVSVIDTDFNQAVATLPVAGSVSAIAVGPSSPGPPRIP